MQKVKAQILIQWIWNRWKTAQRPRGKSSRPIFVKNVVFIGKNHDAHDWQSWNFAQRPIRPCSSKDFKTKLLNIICIWSFSKAEYNLYSYLAKNMNLNDIRIHIRSQKHYSLASNIHYQFSFSRLSSRFFLFWLEFLIISGANIPPIESSSPRWNGLCKSRRRKNRLHQPTVYSSQDDGDDSGGDDADSNDEI